MSISTFIMQAEDRTSTKAPSSTRSKGRSIATTDRSKANSSDTISTESHQGQLCESKLWRHVLGQAVHDIYQGDDKARKEVMIWLRSPDFLTVCDFADADPKTMREQLVALLSVSRPLAQKYGPTLRQQICEFTA